MPSGDRTGPIGRGPMTGRSAGFCSGFSSPGYSNPSFRRAQGRGFGRGFIRGNRVRRMIWHEPYNQLYSEKLPTENKEDEKNYLENMVKTLKEEINEINKRIKQLTEKK